MRPLLLSSELNQSELSCSCSRQRSLHLTHRLQKCLPAWQKRCRDLCHTTRRLCGLRFLAKVLHLNKSLYSLKQAPRIWYLFLCGVVSELGFVALETDSCIHVRGNILLAVHVDDIQVVGPTKEDCDAVYKELEKYIKIEYEGPVRSLLGIDIIPNWDDHLIAINQSAHIDRLLGEFGLMDAKSAGSSLDPSLPLLAAMPGDKMCNIK